MLTKRATKRRCWLLLLLLWWRRLWRQGQSRSTETVGSEKLNYRQTAVAVLLITERRQREHSASYEKYVQQTATVNTYMLRVLLSLVSV